MSVVHKHSSPPGKQILNIHRLALFDELQYFIVISMVVLVVWCGVWRRPSALYWPASINTSPSPSPWEAPLYHHHHRLNLLLVKWHVHEMTSLACVSRVRGSDCTRWWTISPSAADFFYLFIYFTAVLKPLAPTTSTYDSVDSIRTHYSNQRALKKKKKKNTNKSWGKLHDRILSSTRKKQQPRNVWESDGIYAQTRHPRLPRFPWGNASDKRQMSWVRRSSSVCSLLFISGGSLSSWHLVRVSRTQKVTAGAPAPRPTAESVAW